MLSSFINEFVDDSKRSESILKLISSFCQIILQRIPSRKISDCRKTTVIRLQMWKYGQYTNLIEEAYFLQLERKPLTSKKQVRLINDIQKLVKNGRLREASRLINNRGIISGVHKLDSVIDKKTTIQHLHDLHPDRTIYEEKHKLTTKLKKC
ncbi:hypothetical protein GJ496_011859 [Pomphorhynchus laevis]|nr:hypothetical protein GJ496_011859 [Pomphorhynchus laevis]